MIPPIGQLLATLPAVVFSSPMRSVASFIVAVIIVTSLFAWNAWWLHRFARDRSNAEQRAHESEQRFRLLTEYSLDLVVIVDPAGMIHYVSPASTSLFGYRPDEVVGMPPEAFEHPDDMASIRAARACAMGQRGVAVGPVTMRVRHRDGSWRHIEVMHRNLTHEPSIRGVVTYSHDVTDRVRAEKALEHSERYFRTLIEGSYDLVMVTHADGTIRYSSPSVERLIGWCPHDLAGKQILDLLHPDAVAEIERVLESMATTPGLTVVTQEARVSHKDGSWRVLEWTARSCVDDAVISGIIINARDVTERRRAEGELVASARLLEAIIEWTTDIIFVKDHDGRYRMMNAAGAAMVGREKQEVIGKTDHDLFPPKEAARILFADARVITSERPLTMEESFAERDGQLRTYLTTKSPWRDAAGRIGGVIGVAHDISARKRTEVALAYARDQALAVARLKSEFMANMSHEIRTPMNAVIGFTDMILDSDVTADQREMLGALRSSGEKLLALLTDMLDLSKIQSGTAKLEHVSVGVRELVGEAAGMFQAMAQRKGLELTSYIAPDVPDRVLGDRARLRQALVNLIENAVKFTAEGGVAVRTRSEVGTGGKRWMHFTVADTGIGIPIEKQQVIFESFVQGDGSMSRRYGGSGLGLTIASQAVALMGGRLWVKSAEGRGSTFHFTIPLVPPASVSSPLARPDRLHPMIHT